MCAVHVRQCAHSIPPVYLMIVIIDVADKCQSFPMCSHSVRPWVSHFLIHGLICTALYINAMSVCVILFLLGLCKSYSSFVSSNTGKFRMKKCWTVIIRNPDNIHIVYAEMNWKRRLFVGTLRYYTLHFSLFAFFFWFSHSLFGCLKSILIHSDCVHAQRLM